MKIFNIKTITIKSSIQNNYLMKTLESLPSLQRKVIFVTSNDSKLNEANGFLNRVSFFAEKIPLEIQELQSESQEEVVLDKARKAYEAIKRPLIVDDSGIFFHAYSNFPGTFTKGVFKSMGYEGIFKLLNGKRREATFRTLICFTDGKRFNVFEGLSHGLISEKVLCELNNKFPFDSIFVPSGFDRPLGNLNSEERASVSHRKKAFEKLVEFLGE